MLSLLSFYLTSHPGPVTSQDLLLMLYNFVRVVALSQAHKDITIKLSAASNNEPKAPGVSQG